MRTLRWIILTLGVLGGAIGLAATSNAAPLPASAPVAGSVGDGAVTQAQWGRRRWGYRRGWGYRRPFYRPWGFRRRYWGYRRPFYRPWGYRRPYWGYRWPIYRPWRFRRRFYW